MLNFLSLSYTGCIRDFNVMFILDSSGSIGSSNFEIMKAFVGNVIRSLNSTADSKIGVIRFSDDPAVIIPLASTRNLNDLATQVQLIRYIGGGTATDTALDLMVAQLVAASAGSVAPVGILLTDGQSNNPDLTIAAAARVHEAGISMYTFGIGNTNPAELQAIASTPYYDYSFYISSFNAADFDQRVLLLTRQTCTSEFCIYLHYCNTHVLLVLCMPCKVYSACLICTHSYILYVHMYVCVCTKSSTVWLVAPETGQLDEASTHTIAQGEKTYITYPFDANMGVTLQYQVEVGTLNVFGSFSIRNPTQSTADFTFVAELQTTYYVSPEMFNEATGIQSNGRSARQAVSDNATTHTLFTSVSGLNEMNNFTITTVAGDDPGTFGKQ